MTTPQLTPEQIAAMVAAAKKNMAEVDPNATPGQGQVAMQAIARVTVSCRAESATMSHAPIASSKSARRDRAQAQSEGFEGDADNGDWPGQR